MIGRCLTHAGLVRLWYGASYKRRRDAVASMCGADARMAPAVVPALARLMNTEPGYVARLLLGQQPQVGGRSALGMAFEAAKQLNPVNMAICQTYFHITMTRIQAKLAVGVAPKVLKMCADPINGLPFCIALASAVAGAAGTAGAGAPAIKGVCLKFADQCVELGEKTLDELINVMFSEFEGESGFKDCVLGVKGIFMEGDKPAEADYASDLKPSKPSGPYDSDLKPSKQAGPYASDLE